MMRNRPDGNEAGEVLAKAEKVKALIDGVSGAWEPALLLALEDGRLRSGKLRRAVSEGLDYRVFQDTVQRLVDRELLTRVEQGPHDVSYELTDAGRAVVSYFNTLVTWADENPDAAAHVYRYPLAQDG